LQAIPVRSSNHSAKATVCPTLRETGLARDLRDHSGTLAQALRNTHDVDADDRPPICATCGVTMVPAALSADQDYEGEWVCLECEELDEAR
jgi:hypothetical protein